MTNAECIGKLFEVQPLLAFAFYLNRMTCDYTPNSVFTLICWALTRPLIMSV